MMCSTLLLLLFSAVKCPHDIVIAFQIAIVNRLHIFKIHFVEHSKYPPLTLPQFGKMSNKLLPTKVAESHLL
jgi:hypothetical protein